MEQTVQTIANRLQRSGLVSGDAIQLLLSRWQSEANTPEDAQRFVAWLASGQHVTEYQAALLLKGHADGFFLGEYTILDRLGKGRMAGVFKARHRLGQIVAIKVLPPSKAREGNLLDRFRREARLALRLKHPNIVRAFQVGEEKGLHYLVMEHLDGETLGDLLSRRGPLPPAEAVRLVHQALVGLQHLHAEGLVHRDLKPSNLMVIYPKKQSRADTTHCTVKVLDIGLGREAIDDQLADDPGLTSEGVVLGTPDYMAPEQARDARAADVRSDIYSMGCVLYHALSGRPPFPDTNLLSQMIRHATENPTPLHTLNPAVPEGLDQIVGFMLAKNPAERYATPERAAQALQVFLDAGPDDAEAQDADPTYLNWVASKNNAANMPDWLAEMDTVPLDTAQVLVAQAKAEASAAVSMSPSATATPAPATRSTLQASEKPRGSRRMKPVAAPVTVEPIVEAKIEKPAPEAEFAPVPVAPWQISRRDMVVFGAGALAGAAAAFVGCLAALRGRP